ncbi:hypothetical protein B0I35DRAFT_444144 [Stachybotrys elegans]|uniref:Apple domain-containing protein n=1 Tax=Stachybotrys elegans TaxID=80388 RepID=A0A8K0WKA3_9HYPO|nr:hypothetical protein B0I35DRAFT_444144 [Stachybotrys elegans]
MTPTCFSLFFLSLLLSAARADTQAPLAAAGGNCLSLSGGRPNIIYDACCSQANSGKGSVDGVEFTYTCGTWAMPYKTTAVDAGSARECAQLCAAAGKDCPAASWASRGKCYFITAASYSSKPANSILLLEKTGQLVVEPEPTQPGGCGGLVDAAKTQCETDSTAKCEAKTKEQEEALRAECAEQVASVQSQCAGGQENCQAQISTALQGAAAQCQSEKEALVQSGKEQCEQEKTSLTDGAKKQCDADKAALTATFEAEKLSLQKALDEANQKLQAGGGTGGSETASPTSPENEALLQEISRENFSSICPKFAGKAFTTVDSQGYKHEWKLYCHSGVGGASTPYVRYNCHTQNIIQLLTEQQEQPDFKALWVNTNNVCTPWIGGTVFSNGYIVNHHLVLPTREPWK